MNGNLNILMIGMLFCFYIVILMVFQKKSIHNGKYYFLIVANFLMYLLEFLKVFNKEFNYISGFEIISEISTFGLLIIWSYAFVLYVDSLLPRWKKINHIGLTIVDIVALLVMFILPGSIHVISYVVSIISFVIVLINTLINHNNLKSNKKVILMFFSLVFIILYTLLFMEKIDSIFIILIQTISILGIYHWIENVYLKRVEVLENEAKSTKNINEIKNEFLAEMSQEARTSLNIIMGLTDYMKNNDNNSSIKNDLGEIIEESNKLTSIVDNIIDIGRSDDYNFKLLEFPYNFKEEINNLVKVVNAKIVDKQIKFSVNIDETIPYMLLGDKIKIKKVINNLLTNIINLTDYGNVDLDIKSLNYENETLLVMKISDDNLSFDQDEIELILSEQKNLDFSSKIVSFSVLKKMIDLMGGSLKIKKENSNKMIFMIELPQKISEIIDPKKNKKTINIGNKMSSINAMYGDKKILIVDDNKLNIKVAKRTLSRLNFSSFDECYNGKECLDKISSGEQYDLILMDIMMPVMSGEKTMDRLNEIEGFNTPVIALTADAVVGSKEKYLKKGFIDYISKPFTKKEIETVLDKIFKSDDHNDVKYNVQEERWEDVPQTLVEKNLDDII